MQHIRIVSLASLLFAVVGSASAQGHSQDGGHKGAHGDQGNQAKRRDSGGHSAPVPEMEQRQRAKVQQQRAAEYRRQLDRQVLAMQQQNALMQQQKRMAQYRVQQDYGAQLRQQQRLLAVRDYAGDPYVSAPNKYRYAVNGANRQTNQYGADVLRLAVSNGYTQGYLAGQADRQDNAPSSYQATFAYRDANYGYAGSYVDQSDYNYYFRQGLQRGYQDGYDRRSQYGTTSRGTAIILVSLASTILGLQPMP